MSARTESSTRWWLVVPAAGVGRRFGGDEPKQYSLLGTRTVLEHSIERMLAVGGCLGAAVAVHPEDRRWRELPVFTDGRVRTASGGRERADSVVAALQALQGVASDDDWVLVHDAARPCVDPERVRQMIAELSDQSVGGIMACPLADTLKRADARDRISATVDRAGLWRAQTPQMFRYRLLLDSLLSCLEQGRQVTDESSALEACGHSPVLFHGADSNIKITHRDDLEFARLWLSV